MHVAVNAFFWNQPDTGSGQYVRQLVTHLDALVSDLTLTLVWPQLAGEGPPEGVPGRVRVQPVATRPGPLGKVWFEQVGFPRACRALGATLAHVPYWGAPLRAPTPIVVTIHDLITLRFPAYRQRPLARLYTALVLASARGASHVLTDSFASKVEIVAALGRSEREVTAVYLGVSEAFHPPAQSLVDMAVQQSYDLPENYILYLGGFQPHKNVATLIQAYNYVHRAVGDEYPLLLAGRASGATKAPYAALIDDLGLTAHVRWLGYVAEADKPVLYRQATTFAFPSRYEGFGLPVLEALASGVPVVASNVSSLPELLGDAGFAVDPADERALAGALISTLVDERLAADLRRRGPVQAAKFTWAKTATETLNVYLRAA